MKNSFIVFIAILFACSTPAPPSAIVDAAVPPSTTIETPSVDVSPTPMPSWLVSPRAPLGWPEHDAPPVRPPVRKPTLAAAGTRPPIIPTSWTVPAWVIDPVNGNDNNTCTTNGSACKTYAEVAARWGTYSPRLRQNTTLTWLTSQPDNTDPVYFSPLIENNAIVQIIGTLTQVASGSLGSVTVKNRSTPQLLQADIGASGAVNQLVFDTTAGGHAWVYKNVAGTVFALSQPCNTPTGPPLGGACTENNSFANADSFSLQTVPTVDIQVLEPSDGQYTTANQGLLYVTNIATRSPAANRGAIHVNALVRFVECLFNSAIFDDGWQSQPASQGGLLNCDANSGAFGGLVTSLPTGSSQYQVSAGIVSNLTGSAQIDQDVIITFAAGWASDTNAVVGTVYLETATVFTVTSGLMFINTGGVVWGPGSLNIIGQGHIRYPTGGVATTTFLQTGNFQINGLANACSHSNANNPDVQNCAISITAAHLDAAQGTAGFGGNAYVPGGGSISNF